MTSRIYTLSTANQPALKEELDAALGGSLTVLRIVSGDYHDLEGTPLGNLRVTYSTEPDEADETVIAQVLAAHDPARRTAGQERQAAWREQLPAIKAQARALLQEDPATWTNAELRGAVRRLIQLALRDPE